MQHLTLVAEASMMEYLHPVCGSYTLWCVAGVELLLPTAIFAGILILWRSIA